MEALIQSGVDSMEKFYLAQILADIFLDQVTPRTVKYSRRITRYEFEFLDILAGSPPDVNYHDLRELAKEEMLLYLADEYDRQHLVNLKEMISERLRKQMSVQIQSGRFIYSERQENDDRDNAGPTQGA